MARIRTITPAFFKNEQLGDLSPLHRLCFIGLWTQADREGRLEDRPRRLKVELFPYDDVDVDKLLMDLHQRRFIVRYEDNVGSYITITNFAKYQRPRTDEWSSHLPEPPETLGNNQIDDNCARRSEQLVAVADDPAELDTPPRLGDRILGDRKVGDRKVGTPYSPPRERVGDGAAKTKTNGSLEGFDVFWRAYPKKAGKGKAAQVWAKLHPTAELQVTILAAVEQQKRSDQWTKEGDRFVPLPTTWLNQGRWGDDLAAPPRLHGRTGITSDWSDFE